MPSLTDYLGKPQKVSLGTGMAEKAKQTIMTRKAYQAWVLEDPENRSAVSFEEWKSGDTDD